MKLAVSPEAVAAARSAMERLKELKKAVGRARGPELDRAMEEMRNAALALRSIPAAAIAALDAEAFAVRYAIECNELKLNEEGAERLRKWATNHE